MKFLYLMVLSAMCLFGAEMQNQVQEDCDSGNDKAILGNQLDLGQKFCDSSKHVEKKELDAKPIENKDLQKLQEFLNSFDCDKAC